MQDMPTASYARRLAKNEFKQNNFIIMAVDWLEWLAYKERIHICHHLNNRENGIWDRRFPMDRFDAETQTVYYTNI